MLTSNDFMLLAMDFLPDKVKRTLWYKYQRRELIRHNKMITATHGNKPVKSVYHENV